MTGPRPEPRWDAIVIGGGHNALVAAAYLAKGGLRTLVLERRDRVGGAADTTLLAKGIQVPPLAHTVGRLRASVQKDLALSSFGVVSAALAWGFGGAVRGTGRFARGLTDAETGRFDPLTRKAGYYTRRAVMSVVGRRWRDNQIREAR